MLNKLKSIHNTIKTIVRQLKWDKSNLTFSERRLLTQLQDYTLSTCIIKNYRKYVKNNENDSVATIKAKLIRNIILGRIVAIDNYVRAYAYGNLVIWVDRDKKQIFKVFNYRGQYKFEIDTEKREFLNNLLHIENNNRIEFVNGSVIQGIHSDCETVRSKGFHIEMDGV